MVFHKEGWFLDNARNQSGSMGFCSKIPFFVGFINNEIWFPAPIFARFLIQFIALCLKIQASNMS